MSHDHGPRIERTSVLALDPAALDPGGLRRALDRLGAVRSPALAPLVRTAEVPGAFSLTHLVPLGAVSLEELRADGPLRADHVLGVAMAVAEAVVALHAVGLAHGGIGCGHVLVALDGTVVLGGAGLAWGSGSTPRPASDIAAIGDLVRDLLGSGSSSAALVMAALRAADPDPELRPSAPELLEALRRCGRPEHLLDALWSRPAADGPRDVDPLPVGAEPDAATDVTERHSTRPSPGVLRPRAPGSPQRPPVRSPRRLRVRGGRPVLVALAVGALVASALLLTAVRPPAAPVGERLDTEPTTTATRTASVEPSAPVSPATSPIASPTVAAPAPDMEVWVTTLAAVDRGRRSAVEAGSLDQLRRWVDPASPAWSGDAALVRRVARTGARFEGGEVVVDEVRVGEADERTAVLQVRDTRQPYVVTTSAGRTSVPERAARWWTITLRASSAGAVGWRVERVEPASEPVSLSTRRVPR